jgi:hypothetical protein
MFPWLWFYAPHYELPWSGNWQQSIDPDTSFFSAIKPGAGVGEIERQATDVASYGSQLGWITKLLLADDPEAAIPPAKVARARKELRAAYAAIETIKQHNRAEIRRNAEAALERLRAADHDAYAALLAQPAKAPIKPRKGTP